jgi:hypothetical protein
MFIYGKDIPLVGLPKKEESEAENTDSHANIITDFQYGKDIPLEINVEE